MTEILNPQPARYQPSALDTVRAFLAGISAAGRIRHGATPAQTSLARVENQPHAATTTNPPRGSSPTSPTVIDE